MNSRSILETPIGRLAVTANPRGLTQLDLLAEATEVEPVTGSVEGAAHLRVAEKALNAYFSGSPDAFRDLIRREIKRWPQIIKDAGIELQ